MIIVRCGCGAEQEVAESEAGPTLPCGAGCGRAIRLICAERLSEGSGAGDFDARLVVQAGPQLAGEAFVLGGVPDIEIGKLPEKHIVLPGARVSRTHCKLTRVDFGPSQWRITDNKSTNGLFVNDKRVSEHNLRAGDIITIGEYKLAYLVDLPEPAPVAKAPKPISSATAPATARGGRPPTLNYAKPRTAEERLLGNSNPAWVMKLRNASQLMVLALVVSFGSKFLAIRGIDELATVVSALLSWGGAWLIASKEPDAPENPAWMIVRMALRLAATVGTIGDVALVAGVYTENPSLAMGGLVLSLARVGQVFLFLLCLSQLARRLPSPALAVNALIVMVGFSVSLIAMFMGIYAALHGGSGGSLASGLGGFCGAAIFALWYCGLLLWFNKSFS